MDGLDQVLEHVGKLPGGAGLVLYVLLHIFWRPAFLRGVGTLRATARHVGVTDAEVDAEVAAISATPATLPLVKPAASAARPPAPADSADRRAA